MSWKWFTRSARLVQRHVASSPVRCRPNLVALEDRLVLSPVSFHIVQNQSPLTLSGTVGGADIQEQGPGSLTTTYFGDFQADVDEDNGVINFIGTGNDFCAANTGNWAPREDGSGGTAPAIYGLQADVGGTFLGAIRDFHVKVDTFGSALALYPNNDGSFGFASSQILTINAGSGTYSQPDGGHGPINLGRQNGPNQASDGTLYDNGGGNFVVVIPMSFSVSGTIGGMDYTLNIDGVGVGTGNFTGPTRGGHTRTDATISTALVSSDHAFGTVALAAIDANLSPISSRAVVMPTVETSSHVQDVGSGGALAQLVHHAPLGAFDPLTALDSVFKELA